MATIKIISGLICVALLGSAIEPDGNILAQRKHLFSAAELSTAQKVLEVANSQTNVRELTGCNDGKAVEAYLHYTGNRKGEPWCASFVSWVFGQAGRTAPRTAWSPDLFPKSKLVERPRLANVFGIYFLNLKRIAHCGIVIGQTGEWIVTVEGNTNLNGSRDGDGVYRKYRHCKTIKAYSDWLKIEEKGVEK